MPDTSLTPKQKIDNHKTALSIALSNHLSSEISDDIISLVNTIVDLAYEYGQLEGGREVMEFIRAKE